MFKLYRIVSSGFTFHLFLQNFDVWDIGAKGDPKNCTEHLNSEDWFSVAGTFKRYSDLRNAITTFYRNRD